VSLWRQPALGQRSAGGAQALLVDDRDGRRALGGSADRALALACGRDAVHVLARDPDGAHRVERIAVAP
jgi:hypothetical protein